MNSRLEFEEKLWDEGYTRIMGLDEVGRGCLSGPVAAAGVILKPGSDIAGIQDSKTLDLQERTELADVIKQKALFWTVQYCSVDEIDELNILWASLKAMQKCVDKQGANPDYLLVDGNRYGSSMTPYTCLVGGDDRSVSIGAASILAKVHRDELMKDLHEDYPHYGWETNVGYPTAQHYEGLEEHGITRYHRRSFNLRTEKEFSDQDD
ncbi:ribonuclease HII [Aliifodinibius sp. S!AR15-10]|uniref:ribonuclease HII n=1 Tax=Aliifodinibius sp. S!AR15-10 TaxID=2950437 RepID=UPI0028552A8A|nr:ribonuclease HII [Aliifodinibius sp. S!AR15-10]MDR8389780.1 ribonuclease HII [Aliifodinibius sp. S!AR15-10]